MPSSELFAKNLQAFALDNPDHYSTLPEIDCSHYQFIQGPHSEINLKIDGTLLHSSNGPLSEAREWFSQLNLDGIDVLYVYGIGLGYYYEAAKDWLHHDKGRSLTFFEDDLAVVHRFLETEQASVLLKDDQVRLLYFRSMDLDWKVFYWTIWDHLFNGGRVSALRLYEHTKQATLDLLSRRFAYEIAEKRNRMLEDLEYGALLFNNYYRNLLILPQVYLGRGLFGKFPKIPAIICGAGPSLQKHLNILPSFEDRALIFGVGSSMNILNAHGIIPHLGATIDPNPEQLQRLMMNQAYEIPFFYNNRAMHEGVSSLHGPKLFMPGSGAYETADWFEEKLQIPNRPIIQDAYSVVNFALSTALEMGCDPIILIGMDFSDKEGQHYPFGVENHPLYVAPKFLGDSEIGQVKATDIYGEPVLTNWLWLAEANWISFFSDSHPEVRIINASEGGLGILNVPNINLREVVEKHLNQQYDLRGLLHESIQMASMPKIVEKETIRQLLKEFQQSLERCSEACLSGSLEQVIKEPGYQYLLKDFEDSYLRYLHKRVGQVERLMKQGLQSEAEKIRLKVEQQKNAFLNDVAKAHCTYIKNTLEEVLESSSDFKIPSFTEDVSELSKTTFVDGLRQGDATLYYRNGAIYGKLHYKDNRFEGKQLYYYSDGTLKTELTYQNGLLDGVVRLYYPNGLPKLEQSFKNGIRHGLEKRWYGNGQLFIEVNYNLGKPLLREG